MLFRKEMKTTENKNYIVYDNFKIGYIKSLCVCPKCKERGTAEVFINDLEGKYQDCIKANEIENIIYFGNSLTDAVKAIIYQIKRKELENKYLQSLVDFYSKELVNTKE